MIENYWRQTKERADIRDCLLLEACDTWRTVPDLGRCLGGWEPDALRSRVSTLTDAGILVEEGSPALRTEAAIGAWHAGQAARHFYFGTRDLRDFPIDADPAVAREIMRREPQPDLFKTYPDAPRIPLPTGWPPCTMSLEQALLERESVRSYADTPIPLLDLSHLLYLTYGQTGWRDGGVFGDLVKKTSASAGGRHPIEAYLIVRNVADLAPGAYHYAVKGHALELLREGDLRGMG